MQDALVSLDADQRRAVEFPCHVPLIVAAGAGSGKTRVLTLRVSKLILEDRVDPATILALTFTTRARQEMKDRVFKSCGSHVPISVQTFHSFGLEVVRNHYRQLGFWSPPVVLDASAQADLVKDCIDSLPPSLKSQLLGETKHKDLEKLTQGEETDENGLSFWSSYFDTKSNSTHLAVAFVVQANRLPEQDLATYGDAVRQAVHSYQKKKRQSSAVDFDDLLPLALQLFSTQDPSSLGGIGKKQHILVDEFQDVSSHQLELLKVLLQNKKQQGTITVCGDQDQAIFSFVHGGARNNFDAFKQHWPQAQICQLKRNYRSTPTVVQASKAVIQNNPQSATSVGAGAVPARTFTDGGAGSEIVVSSHATFDKEASFIAQDIKRASEQGIPYREMAIMFRTRVVGKSIEKEMAKQGIPLHNSAPQLANNYKKGLAMDFLSYIKLAINPRDDEALVRAAKLQIGLGNSAMEKLQQSASQFKCSKLEAARRILRFNATGWTAGQKGALRRLVACVESTLADIKLKGSAAEVLEALGARVCLEQSESKRKDKASTEIRKMVQSMKDDLILVGEDDGAAEDMRTQRKLEAFLSCLEGSERTRPSASANSGVARGLKEARRQNVVTLTTVHQAKGLEFGYVWLVRFIEGIFPVGCHAADKDAEDDHAASDGLEAHLQEERRLAYVAVSRAKERLHISWARQDEDGEFREHSRFLSEIPESLRKPWSKQDPHAPPSTSVPLTHSRVIQLSPAAMANIRTGAADHRQRVGDRGGPSATIDSRAAMDGSRMGLREGRKRPLEPDAVRNKFHADSSNRALDHMIAADDHNHSRAPASQMPFDQTPSQQDRASLLLGRSDSRYEQPSFTPPTAAKHSLFSAQDPNRLEVAAKRLKVTSPQADEVKRSHFVIEEQQARPSDSSHHRPKLPSSLFSSRSDAARASSAAAPVLKGDSVQPARYQLSSRTAEPGEARLRVQSSSRPRHPIIPKPFLMSRANR